MAKFEKGNTAAARRQTQISGLRKIIITKLVTYGHDQSELEQLDNLSLIECLSLTLISPDKHSYSDREERQLLTNQLITGDHCPEKMRGLLENTPSPVLSMILNDK